MVNKKYDTWYKKECENKDLYPGFGEWVQARNTGRTGNTNHSQCRVSGRLKLLTMVFQALQSHQSNSTNKDRSVKVSKHNKYMRILKQTNQSLFKTEPSAEASSSTSSASSSTSSASSITSAATDMQSTVPAQSATQPNQQTSLYLIASLEVLQAWILCSIQKIQSHQCQWDGKAFSKDVF